MVDLMETLFLAILAALCILFFAGPAVGVDIAERHGWLKTASLWIIAAWVALRLFRPRPMHMNKPEATRKPEDPEHDKEIK